MPRPAFPRTVLEFHFLLSRDVEEKLAKGTAAQMPLHPNVTVPRRQGRRAKRRHERSRRVEAAQGWFREFRGFLGDFGYHSFESFEAFWRTLDSGAT